MLGAPVIVTAPVTPAIPLNELKAFVRVDGDAFDVELQAYLDGAVAEVEAMTATRLAEQLVSVSADIFADLAHLQVGPVNAVTGISYEDSTSTVQTLSTDVYELFGSGLDSGIRLKTGQSWPVARSVGSPISVTLNVGYADDKTPLPTQIRLAVLMSARARFDGIAADIFPMTVNDRIWM